MLNFHFIVVEIEPLRFFSSRSIKKLNFKTLSLIIGKNAVYTVKQEQFLKHFQKSGNRAWSGKSTDKLLIDTAYDNLYIFQVDIML